MAPKPFRNPPPFLFKLFKRRHPGGGFVYYARFFDRQSGQILAQRSLGTNNPVKAATAAGRLLGTLPLAQLARARRAEQSEELTATEHLSNMPLSDFFTWFWSDASDYIADKRASEKPLSSEYVRAQGRYVQAHASGYAGFRKTMLRDASLLLVERWARSLRISGVSPNVIVDAMNAIRTPLSWARKRNLLEIPFTFEGIERPKESYRKRGILSRDELGRIVALPCIEHLTPRPRLAGGQKNQGLPPIDLRMKTAIMLSEFAALRLGEIRGLLWRNVDWERELLHIEENVVRNDGRKEPKADSKGDVPFPKEVRDALIPLRELAERIGWYRPEYPVIFNSSPGKPVSETTIVRGYHRALQLIGIEDDRSASKENRPPHPGSIQARHLVLHSGRHGAATRLAERVGPQLASRATRHRSLQVFLGYAGHDSDESLQKLRDAMGMQDQPSLAQAGPDQSSSLPSEKEN